jgi:hypothetical protein
MISPIHACVAQFNWIDAVVESLCLEPQPANRCGDAAKMTLNETESRLGDWEPPQNMG